MNNRYREEELNEKENNPSEQETQGQETQEQEIQESETQEQESQEMNEDEACNKNSKHHKKIKKLETKIETLTSEKEELEKKLKDANTQYLRLLADTENFKKRIEEEKIRDRKYASQRLLEKLITNIDIFDKAVNMKTDDQNLMNFLIGFQMINNNLKTILEEEGVKKINSNGMFDPHYHHAVETDYDETKEEGAILAVIKDGYMYKDRVLVAALVKVNKKPEEKTEENK